MSYNIIYNVEDSGDKDDKHYKTTDAIWKTLDELRFLLLEAPTGALIKILVVLEE